VLGVWIGNFDGTPNANLIGREAGSVVLDLVDALRARGGWREALANRHLNLKRLKVCARLGPLPAPTAIISRRPFFIPGKSPIATCSINRAVRIDTRTGLRPCLGGAAAVIAERPGRAASPQPRS
jgi:penicillin-binding protein 1C